MSDVSFEQVKQMIEQLPANEVERLRLWLNNPASRPPNQEVQQLTWGERLVALIENFPLEAADQMNIDNPEAWVREQRRKKTHRRNPGWGEV